MPTVSIRVDANLFSEAASIGKAEYRSAAQQINYWAMLGKNALANPDLPIEFIRETLIAKSMPSEPFEFRED